MSLDQKILPFKYEDLIADKGKVCETVLGKLEFDRNHLDDVVSAFENDSQRGTIVSRSRIGNTPRRRISDTDRIRADRILASYSLPAMGEDFRI